MIGPGCAVIWAQVYRWRLDHKIKLDIIERYDAKQEQWVRHDNDLLRGAFMDQQDASLSTIHPVTKQQAHKLTVEGPQ